MAKEVTASLVALLIAFALICSGRLITTLNAGTHSAALFYVATVLTILAAFFALISMVALVDYILQKMVEEPGSKK
jgi:hypothetical protein